MIDMHTIKYAYLHLTAMLNVGGEAAQSRRNGCAISRVMLRNLTRNNHRIRLVPVRRVRITKPAQAFTLFVIN